MSGALDPLRALEDARSAGRVKPFALRPELRYATRFIPANGTVPPEGTAAARDVVRRRADVRADG